MAVNRNQYAIRTSAGAMALPCVGNVSYEYEKMDDQYSQTFVEVQYFSSSDTSDANKVQPTAGTCVCDGAYSDRLNWLELINGTHDAATSESSSRAEPPSGRGPLVAGRVTFAGVSGATHAIVVYHKYGK